MKKSLTSYLITIGIHVSISFILYLIFSFFGFIKGFPTNESIAQWDVGWYQSIVKNGYSFHPDQQSNVAFFPLFPLVWKLLSASPIGISVMNLMFLFIGVYLLYRLYHLERSHILLILSVPSLFFCYVPYSEAIFFFACSLTIYGLYKNEWLAILGVFLACLTRSASLIFIPILLYAKLYNYRLGANNKKLIRETILLITSAIISTLLSQYIQYLESGEFFTLFEAQKAWDRYIRVPVLYLTTWDEGRLIWLDGLALFTGLTATGLSIAFLIRKMLDRRKTISPGYLFSIAYLAVVTIVTVFYSGQDATGGTSIYSLNRFVFSTPFFMVFLIVLLKKNRFHKKGIVLFFATSLTTWLLFHANGHLHYLERFALPHLKTQIYFGLIFLYSLLYLLITNKTYKTHLCSGLYVINLMVQIYLFNSFLNGVWIG